MIFKKLDINYNRYVFNESTCKTCMTPEESFREKKTKHTHCNAQYHEKGHLIQSLPGLIFYYSVAVPRGGGFIDFLCINILLTLTSSIWLAHNGFKYLNFVTVAINFIAHLAELKAHEYEFFSSPAVVDPGISEPGGGGVVELLGHVNWCPFSESRRE